MTDDERMLVMEALSLIRSVLPRYLPGQDDQGNEDDDPDGWWTSPRLSPADLDQLMNVEGILSLLSGSEMAQKRAKAKLQDIVSRQAERLAERRRLSRLSQCPQPGKRLIDL